MVFKQRFKNEKNVKNRNSKTRMFILSEYIYFISSVFYILRAISIKTNPKIVLVEKKFCYFFLIFITLLTFLTLIGINVFFFRKKKS